MNIPKIIIRPDETIDTVKDPIGESNLYVEPFGIHSNNEVSDYRVHGGDTVNYHYHDHGFELFTIISGSVECVLGGKRCIAYPGDMILVRPYTPHAFLYREDGTIWQETVLELSLYENERALGRVNMNCPEKLKDPAFMVRFQAGNGRKDYPNFPALQSDMVDDKDMPAFRRKGEYYKSYELPGIKMGMKFGKWDLNGQKEIWEYILDKGTSLKTEFVHSADQFIVKSGSVRVEVQNLEPQIAYAGDIINIPSYTSHTITALEDNTALHDNNCEYDMLMMLEEYAITCAEKPELKGDEAFLASLREKYECTFTWSAE